MFKFLLAALAIGLASAHPLNKDDDSLIVGGFETTIEENPWQVSLRRSSIHDCGGSIIDKNWVLTAGHCVGGIQNQFSVRVGSSRYASGGKVIKIKNVYRHEKYNGRTIDFDFALLELAEPLLFDDSVQAIKLPSQDLGIADGTEALVSGWGDTKNSNESNAIIRAAYVPITNQDNCNKQYKTIGYAITERIICAGFEEGGRDTCQGDSGGPLSIESEGSRVLVGVVSWGNGCALPVFPGVYARVSAVRSWIKNISGV